MRNYHVDYFPKQCMCGSKRWRGMMTGWKDLSDEKKKEYEGFVAPYLLELDAKQHGLQKSVVSATATPAVESVC